MYVYINALFHCFIARMSEVTCSTTIVHIYNKHTKIIIIKKIILSCTFARRNFIKYKKIGEKIENIKKRKGENEKC